MRLFVPGRICLFGEHSDWAAGYRRVNPQIERGYALIAGTNQGLYADVRPHPDALILSAVTDAGEHIGPLEIPMEAERLLEEAQSGSFFSYAAGVAYQALTYHQVQGLVVENDRTDLPIKKGLSSSAAICVLVARAFNRLYGLKLTVRGEMEMAYQGEITTASQCGRMDQGCAYGQRPVLMTFDGARLATREVSLGGPLHLLVVDLKAQKDTRTILARLNAAYPFAQGGVSQGVQELLGATNRRMVHEAVDALEQGDAPRLGALMVEAQALFDRHAEPACPEELAAPALHRVLAYEPLQGHVWGGKGVGSQGDGAAQFVCRSAADQDAAADIVVRKLGMDALKLTLVPDAREQRRAAFTVTRDHARLRTAVIPAAGRGTRLFPATKAIKKEMFPLVGHDGVARPALLLMAEEALSAGVERLVIVTQPGDVESFRAFFAAPLDGDHYERLPDSAQRAAQRIEEIGRRVTFAVQEHQEGFGHAVSCAREAVGDEPFLLMLGDYVYRSNGAKTCAQQMAEAFAQRGVSVVGVERSPEAEIGHRGVVGGAWIEEERLLDLSELAEKPASDYAHEHLRVAGLPRGEYLTLFGLYALEPQIFDILERHITAGFRERGEFQLTSALDELRAARGFAGLVIDGQCFDIGRPDAYVEALQAFRTNHHVPG